MLIIDDYDRDTDHSKFVFLSRNRQVRYLRGAERFHLPGKRRTLPNVLVMYLKSTEVGYLYITNTIQFFKMRHF